MSYPDPITVTKPRAARRARHSIAFNNPIAPRRPPTPTRFSGFRSFFRIGRPLAVLAALTLRLTAASPSSDPSILDGEQHDDGFGNTVTGVGDVNRDGYADLLIAAPLYDGQRGRVFVFHGSQAGLHRQPGRPRNAGLSRCSTEA